MRRTILLTVCTCIVLSTVPCAKAYMCLIYECDFNGVTYRQQVTSDDLTNYPSWTPDTQPCPMATPNAIQLARQFVRREFPEIKGRLRLQAIAIRRLVTHKWAYFVTLAVQGDPSYPVDGDGINRATIEILVGINGWIPPIKRWNFNQAVQGTSLKLDAPRR